MRVRTIDQIKADIAELEAMEPTGCCMCGDSDDHSPWLGHTPVNDRDYYLSIARQELQEAQR